MASGRGRVRWLRNGIWLRRSGVWLRRSEVVEEWCDVWLRRNSILRRSGVCLMRSKVVDEEWHLVELVEEESGG